MRDSKPILIVDAGPDTLGAELASLLQDYLHAPVCVTGAGLNDLPGDASVLLVCSSCEAMVPLLGRLRRQFVHSAVIGVAVDEAGGPERMLELLALGADDFLCAPVRAVDLVPRVQRLMGHADAVPASAARFPFILGRSRALQQVIDKVPRIARSDATCVLYGETGTGKELFARAIHYSSRRSSSPFIPVNCGALPDTLFENELFGHARGAYTDASTRQPGLLRVAEHGTLFLDEVDTLSPAAQVKVLRLLQEREYRPLGSGETVKADVRILAATNTELRLRVAARQFREDLFHRLNVLYLTTPSLRSRPEDIPEMAEALITRYSEASHPRGLRLSVAAMHKLMVYPWPGNVRELESVLQRAVVLAPPDTGLLLPADIDLPEQDESGASPGSLRDAKSSAILQFERDYLVRVLAECGGNVSRAARASGKERRGFQRLLQKHHIDRATFVPTGV